MGLLAHYQILFVLYHYLKYILSTSSFHICDTSILFFIFILLLWFHLITHAHDEKHLIIGVSRSIIFILFEELIELIFCFLNSLFCFLTMVFEILQFMSSNQQFFAHFWNLLLFWVVHLRSHPLRNIFGFSIDLLVVVDLIFVWLITLGINIFIMLFFILLTLI